MVGVVAVGVVVGEAAEGLMAVAADGSVDLGLVAFPSGFAWGEPALAWLACCGDCGFPDVWGGFSPAFWRTCDSCSSRLFTFSRASTRS